MARFHKAFQGYDQHDAHEFLIKLMDWIHDDLNLVSFALKFPIKGTGHAWKIKFFKN